MATNANTQVLARTLNMPYGSARWSSGTLPTDYGFTGQKDTGLGLVYMHARYYVPYLSHWVQPDSVIPDPANPQTSNRYSYVNNNPVKYRDPSGHFTEEDLLQWGVFSSYEQMHLMKEDDVYAYWYWLLRAASFGDFLELYAYKFTGHFTYEPSVKMIGRLEFRKDNKLWFVNDWTIDSKYQVSWFGLLDPSDPEHYFATLPLSLLTTEGVLHNVSEARRHAQLKYAAPEIRDYVSFGGSAYAGVGGGFVFKFDRYGRVYLTFSLGVGLGGKGGWAAAGKFVTDYTLEKGELMSNMTGATISGSAAAGFGPLVSLGEGPTALEFGGGSVGASLSVDFTVLLWDFSN